MTLQNILSCFCGKFFIPALDKIDSLDWPARTKAMQKNWIGKKEGINITYEVKNTQEKITCFTTRPDTNFGATFIVLAPEHDFAKKILAKKLAVSAEIYKKVSAYIQKALSKTDLDRIFPFKPVSPERRAGADPSIYFKRGMGHGLH